MIDIEQTNEGIVLPVSAQPRARKSGLVSVHAGRLKVAVTEVPEKGKANTAIQKVLVKTLGLKRSQISLVSGASSSQKKFLITGLAANELQLRINTCLE